MRNIDGARTRINGRLVPGRLLHEFAHALLHFDVDDGTERTKREVEAEPVAYIVGRYCGLDTSGSAFYLAAWNSEDTEVIQERLQRISRRQKSSLVCLLAETVLD